MNIQPINLANNFRLNKTTTKTKHQNPISQSQNNNIGLSTNKINNDRLALAFLGLNGITGKNIDTIPTTENDVPVKLGTTIEEAETLIKEVDELTQKAQEEASEIYQKGQRTAQEVIDLYNRIRQGNYQGTAKLVDGILEEFDEKGNLIRTSVIFDGSIDIIEEYNKKKTNVLTFSDNKPREYRGGFRKLANGTKRIDVALYFVDNCKEILYKKGFRILTDGSEKTDVRLTIEDNHPEFYQKGIEKHANGSKKTDYTLYYWDKKPNFYCKNSKEFADGSLKVECALEFKDEKPSWYTEDKEILTNGFMKTRHKLEFVDGKWQEAKEE